MYEILIYNKTKSKLPKEVTMEALKISSHNVSVFQVVHGDSKGTIQISHIDKAHPKSQFYGIQRQYGTLVKQYIENFTTEYNNTDMYFSLNTFRGLRRRQSDLHELKALWSDIDYYNTGFTKDQVLLKITDLVHNGRIPQPTLLVDSGKGLYMIWKIERTPPQALVRWKNIMSYLHTELSELGADPRCLEPARIFRLDNSIHSETKKTVHVISYTPVTYTLHSLQSNFLIPKKSDTPIKKSRPKTKKYSFAKPNTKQILYLHNNYKTYAERLQDIEKLCELRDYKLHDYHCREVMLFLTRYWHYCYTKDEQAALKRALALNKQFDVPLAESEVINNTRSNEKAKKLQVYRYSNGTLITLLQITEEEQYQLQSIHTKEIARKKLDQGRKAARRNEEGLTSREQQRKDTEEQIKKLNETGLSTKEIAMKLGLTIRHVQRIKKAATQ